MTKKQQIDEFLQQSNFIEREYRPQAFEDAKKAWDYAYKNRKKMNIPYVLEIHRLLMQNLRPDIAGKFRNCDVWIGGERRRYISAAIFEADLDEMLTALEQIDSYKQDMDKEALSRQMHVRFEKIHPFEDGNGRVGRILWNISRLNAGLDIKIIHEGEEQFEYYQMFR